MEGVGQLPEGTVFAGYQIVKPLGVGGFGAVYLARHPNLNKHVALKLLDYRAANEQVRELVERKFHVEADLLAKLDEHENIVTVFDRGTADGVMWIAMRYVAGVDCDRAVSSGPLTPDRAVRIIDDVANALGYAHHHGVVHRDVKPANILLVTGPGEAEHAMLTDFGIAKVIEETQVAAGSAIMLSPACAAPEQFDGVGVDHRADIYGLGCTLFILLTGAAPYADVQGLGPTANAHKNAAIPRPSATPGVPKGFDSVISKALAKKPGQRYSSATELADAAREALGGAVTLVQGGAGGKKRKGRKRRFLAAGIIGLCAVAVAAWAVINHRIPGPSAATSHPSPSATADFMTYTAAEQQLLGVLPPDYTRSNCAHEAPFGPGYSAAVHCTGNLATGVPEAHFLLVDSQHSVQDKFTNVGTRGPRYACVKGEPQPARIIKAGRATGLVTCYSEGSSPRLMWTNDTDRTIGLAYGQPGGIETLLQWWRTRGAFK
jgi:tRNA A-37 threonylcarbamoyl transferase component Bud32